MRKAHHKSLLHLYLFMIAAILASCDKLDKNGDLDGAWQLTSLQRTEDGTVMADKNSRIFYYFKLDLMELRQVNDTMYYLARFKHTGDSLIIGPVYQSPFDSLVVISEVDAKFGIADGHMHVNRLTSDDLELENKQYKIQLRKF